MKVLVVATHIYNKEIYSTKSMVNGLAIMIKDIFDQVSLIWECYGYATNSFSYKNNDDRFKLLSSTKWDYVKTLSLADCLWLIKEYKAFSRSFKELIFSRMSRNLFLKYYNQVKPDIVNFHDLSEINSQLMDLCDQLAIPYILTNHLYVGKKNKNETYKTLEILENNFFNKGKINVSVVSSGVKKRILMDYPNIKASSIRVIGNGTNIVNKNTKSISSINGSRVICLCIGNIMARKNQAQLINAVQLLPDEVRKQLVILFIGEDKTLGFADQIKHSDCSETLQYVGPVPYEDMDKYYSKADYTITVSLNEGFGLTIIEGFVYGVPAILYEDLDSFDDIYDDKSCLAIRERDDLSLAKALERAVNLRDTWDRDYIQKYSERFSMQQVGEKYVEMFNEIINNSYNEKSTNNC